MVGDFTCGLGNALGAVDAQDLYTQHSVQMPEVRIDGPFGAPAEDVFNNTVAVLIGTGIGVTPWAAVLRNIWHLHQNSGALGRLRRVDFIWIYNDTTSVEWLQALLSSLEIASQESVCGNGNSKEEFLRIHTYLTQKVSLDTAQNIVLNSSPVGKDPLTKLKVRTNFGRPNFTNLLREIRVGILDGDIIAGEGYGMTDVGVFFCGSKAAAKDVKDACERAKGPPVNFIFKKETF